jgi:hypothetical protein
VDDMRNAVWKTYNQPESYLADVPPCPLNVHGSKAAFDNKEDPLVENMPTSELDDSADNPLIILVPSRKLCANV